MAKQSKLQTLLTGDRGGREEEWRRVMIHDQPIRLEANQYEVHDANGQTGVVTLRLPAIDVHWIGHSRESHSLVELTEQARDQRLPRWAKQVPLLVSKIEAIFQREREQGRGPHIQVGVSGDEVFYADLARGTRISRTLRDLRQDLARGRTLPGVFDTEAVRLALVQAA